jgi:hypothetical protein
MNKLHMVPCTSLPAATITIMLCTAAPGAFVIHAFRVIFGQNLSKCLMADRGHPGASLSPVRLSDVYCTMLRDV